MPEQEQLLISVMLAVPDAPSAAKWYKQALGATELWDLGSVVGLEVADAPFFLAEPENNGWDTPERLGMPSVRVEVFCDDPDGFIARAVAAGADSSKRGVRCHKMPWGVHRQGGFTDPFGHIWFVGDRSPLGRFPKSKERDMGAVYGGNGADEPRRDVCRAPRASTWDPGAREVRQHSVQRTRRRRTRSARVRRGDHAPALADTPAGYIRR